MNKMINIALVGLGQVGIYLLNELNSKKKDIEIKTGKKIKVVAVSARNINKKRQFKFDKKLFYKNPLDILKKHQVDILFEAIGQSDGISKKIVEAGQLSIGIGGGHDLAYGHFCGIKKALKKSKIGIINFDAHFDLRPPNKKSNSGTPFHQILNKFKNEVNYLPVGIQKFSNPESLYKIASKFKIDYVPIEDCTLNNMKNIFFLVDNFIKESEFIYLSIDLDGFASCHAPGVSAPGPFGFSVEFFRILFKYILKTKKVVAIDIVELNPLYDIDSRTAKLAAHIINMAVTK